MNFCEKYRANCFKDIEGQDEAIEKIDLFFKNFVSSMKTGKEKKALLLHGPAGTGKTSLAYAFAGQENYELLELNASNLRNREQLEKVIRPAIEQRSLFSKGKVILIDEVDGISTADKGGLQTLTKLIDDTNFPMIITANNIWHNKFSSLRRKCELVQLRELHYETIFSILKKICEKEKIKIREELLKSIAIKARGDVRAALNDLETLAIDKREEIKPDFISERDKEDNIFNVLRQIFKNSFNSHILQIYNSVNMPLDEIFLWLDENLPIEYACREGTVNREELARAYEALSLADVFRGRIHRRQHWRFLVYQNIFLSAGISLAKKASRPGFTSYRKPGRILKIWLANQKNAKKKGIAEKYARFCHISKKRAIKEIFFFSLFANKDIAKRLRLDEDEYGFLREMKQKASFASF